MAIVTLPDDNVKDPIGSIISWPSEDFFDNFWRFCSISSLQTTESTTTRKWADGRIPLLPIGQPISLSALVPGPGELCPALTYPLAPSSEGNDSNTKTIDPAIVPPSAIVDYQWKIQVADYDKIQDPNFLTQPVSIFDANDKPATMTQDTYAIPGVDYTIISGSLNSKRLTIMPVPTSAIRAFQIYLKINLWWPSRDNKDFTIPQTQGTAANHSKGTKYAAPKPFNLRCFLTPLVAASIPKPPTDDIYSKFKSLCSAKCEQLKIGNFTDPAAAKALAAQPMPIGQALSLTSLLPTDIDIPKGGLPLPDGTSIATPGPLPLGTQVDAKWLVEIADFKPTEVPKSTDFKVARPSLSHADLGGRFDVVTGGLSLPALSLNMWPESSITETKDKDTGITGRAPSQLKRAFQIRLQVTLSAPTRSPTTFYLPPPSGSDPKYFVGVVDSWANAFGAATDDGSSKLATLPKTLTVLNNAPDPTQFVRNLFTTTMGDLSPDPGHFTNLLVTPTDKVKHIPQQLKEIVTQKPSAKIQAAIDLGAGLDAAAKSALGALGIKSDNNPVAAAGLNVLDILTNIFSIPVAVDINAESVSQTLTPLVPVPIPALEAVKGAPSDLVPGGLGSPAIIGQVPIGSLRMLVGTCVNDITWKSDSDNSLVQISRLRDVFGLSFLPVPVFQALGQKKNPRANFDIRLRLNISVPGGSTPMTLDLDLARVELKVPVVSIPQILVGTRYSFSEPPQNWSSPYHNESLWLVDLWTAKLIPNIHAVQAILATLGGTLRSLFRVFRTMDLNAADQQAPEDQKYLVEALAGWTSLATTIGQMTTLLASQIAANPAGPMLFSPTPNTPFKLDKQIGSEPWFKTTGTTSIGAGISGLMWIGAPQAQFALQLHVQRNNGYDESLWFPSAWGTHPANAQFPERGPTQKPYTKYSFINLEGPNDTSPHIWVTRHKNAEGNKPAVDDNHTLYDFQWWDSIDYIQYTNTGRG